MFSTSASLALGILFVCLGVACVWLFLESTRKTERLDRAVSLIAAHRIAGYSFIAIFGLMFFLMSSRLGDTVPGERGFHQGLALLLVPLLFVKVLLARRYRNHSSLLLPIGISIFVLSFLLVAVPSWPRFSRLINGEPTSSPERMLPNSAITTVQAAALMEKKCAKCHNLERVVGAKKDAKGWNATVTRMQKMPESGIGDEDAQLIAHYLRLPPWLRQPVKSVSTVR